MLKISWGRRAAQLIAVPGLALGLTIATLSAVLPSQARAQEAPNEFTIEGGRADDGIDVVGARIGRPYGIWEWAGCRTFSEADAEYWHARESQQRAPGSLETIGAMGGCRFWDSSRFSPELGFGVRLLSHVQIVDDKEYSTAFQFQEMLGVRAKLTDDGRYFADFRARHISNGSIKRPNAGINTLLLSVGMDF
jgi:hypothetical protein